MRSPGFTAIPVADDYHFCDLFIFPSARTTVTVAGRRFISLRIADDVPLEPSETAGEEMILNDLPTPRNGHAALYDSARKWEKV